MVPNPLSGQRRLWTFIVLPCALTILVVAWSAIANRSWLFTAVVAAVGVADLPFLERLRMRCGTTVTLLLHLGVLIVGWVVASLVTLPFANFE